MNIRCDVMCACAGDRSCVKRDFCMLRTNPNTSVNLLSRYTTDICDEGGIAVSLETGKKNDKK